MSDEDVCKKIWVQYKTDQKLEFKKEEENRRFDNFYRSQVFISNFNNGVRNTHVCEHNHLSHLSDDEYRAILTVKCCTPTYLPPFMLENNTHLDCIPASFDYRDYGTVNRVKNQGLWGTSWAFSAVAAIEAAFAESQGVSRAFSEQHMIDCCDSAYGRYAGLPENAFAYVKKNGIMFEKHYPYEGNQGPKRYDPYDVFHIQDYYWLKNSESALEGAIYNLGPVSVAINASSNSFRFYKKGIYFDPYIASVSDKVDHAVLCTGYEYSKKNSHWVLKNSFGEKWGEGGFMRLRRDGRGFAGITTLASVPIVYDFMCRIQLIKMVLGEDFEFQRSEK